MINWIRSALVNNCPRCRQSKLFIKPLVLSKPLAMNEACDHCGQHFEPEPGFYYGAMFLSYTIGSFVILPAALVMVFYFGMNVEKTMLILVAISILMYLKLLRGSRSLWIHIMIKYEGANPSKKKNKKQLGEQN